MRTRESGLDTVRSEERFRLNYPGDSTYFKTTIRKPFQRDLKSRLERVKMQLKLELKSKLPEKR